MSGWVKLYRKLTEWEWYDDINTSRLFIHLLLMANHTDKNWKGFEIKRGQRLTSIDKLSSETGLTVSQVRTCIRKLKKTNEVTSKSHSQHTVFTIEKYELYQGSDKQDDKEIADDLTYESQTNDKPMTTNKNDKNDKNEKKASKPSKAKPLNAQEVQDYFAERGYGEPNIGNRFVDHYDSLGWMRGKTKIKCWKGTARTWMGRMTPYNQVSIPDQQQTEQQKQNAYDEMLKDF